MAQRNGLGRQRCSKEVQGSHIYHTAVRGYGLIWVMWPRLPSLLTTSASTRPVSLPLTEDSGSGLSDLPYFLYRRFVFDFSEEVVVAHHKFDSQRQRTYHAGTDIGHSVLVELWANILTSRTESMYSS